MNKTLPYFLCTILCVLHHWVFAADLSPWTYHQDIYLNTTSSGADVSTSVSDFPVLIRLNNNYGVFDEAMDNGEDIRFTKADETTLLDHEIERWDKGGTQAEIWVRIPTIAASDNTHIVMHWGKSGETSQSSGENVFRTSDNYAGVWHFKPINSLHDATANNNDLTNHGTVEADGIIGKSRECELDNTDDLSIDDNSSLSITSSFTVSCWMNLEQTGNWFGIISKGAGEWRFVTQNQGADNDLTINISNNTDRSATSLLSSSTNTWYHVAAVFDDNANTVTFYKDGNQLGSTVTGVTETPSDGTNTLHIGGDQGDDYFDGLLDEVRVEKTTRSAAWMRLCYQNQNSSAQKLVEFGEKRSVSAPHFTTNPQSTTVDPGDAVTFTAVATGSTPIEYQWQKDSTDLSEEESTSLTIDAVTEANAGTYRCIATNTEGADTSDEATLTVNDPPAITTHPVSDTIAAGESVDFTIAVTGSTPLEYQWQKDGADIGGANSLTYSITDATESDAGSYRAIASNSAGDDTSNAAELTVWIAPSIATHPQSDTARTGGSHSFTAAAGGAPAPSFSWLKDGEPIPDSSRTTLALGSLTFADSGYYQAVASNAVGRDTSDSAFLAVVGAPVITTQPEVIQKFIGQSITLSVAAEGNPAPQYQWLQDGVEIPVTNSSFSIFDLKMADSGKVIQAVAYNIEGADTSDSAILIVDSLPEAPSIIEHPVSDTVYEGDSVLFAVVASGNPDPHYTWQKDDIDLPGAPDNDTLLLYDIVLGDSGSYRVIVYNDTGADTSDTATLTVLSQYLPPAITTQPAAVTTTPDSTVEFTVGVSGSPVLQYQWQKNSQDLMGMNSKTLTISNVEYADSGLYRVVVWNDSGTATSAQAKLSVEGPPVILEQPKSAVKYEGESVVFRVKAEGNPPVSFQWFKESDTIPGATDSVYRIDDVTLDDVGIYTVRVINDRNTVISDGAQLTVYERGEIINPLTLDAAYIDTETVTLTLGGYDGLSSDTSQQAYVDSVIVWYKAGGFFDVPDDSHDGRMSFFLDTIQAQGSSISFDTSVGYSSTDSVYYFGASVLWRGPAGDSIPPFSSASNDTVIMRDTTTPPIGTFRVWGRHIDESSDTAWLYLDNVSALEAPVIESVFVWCSFSEEFDDTFFVRRLALDTVQAGADDNTFAIAVTDDSFSGDFDTVFCAASALGVNGRSSAVVDSFFVVGEKPSEYSENTIEIDSLWFEQESNEIRVEYSLRTPDSVKLEYGYTYVVQGAVLSGKESPEYGGIIRNQTSANYASISIADDIVFDTVYNVSLWLSKNGGAWIAPTASSRDTVRTPPFTWQQVHYFGEREDTVTAFNNTLILRKSPKWTVDAVINDIIRVVDPAPSGADLVPVSTTFAFDSSHNSPLFYIDIRYDESKIPAGNSASDLRVYRLNADSLWEVTPRSQMSLDTASGAVTLFASDVDTPFRVMVDTREPAVSVLSSTGAPVEAGAAVRDTIRVRDNVANTLVKIYCGRGEEDTVLCDSVRLTDTLQTTFTKIPSNYVSEVAGVRIIVVADDGRYGTPVNVSRRVRRDTSDVMSTEVKKWVPLRVTADLDSQDISYALRKIKAAESSWKYDNTKFRIFRWFPNKDNESSSDKWVEYVEDKDAFTLTPGRLLWIKTVKTYTFDFGTGVTLSLTDTASIDLPGENWTDFALPCNMRVKIGDILASTGTAGESLEFYEWTSGADDENYALSPLFLPRMDKPELEDSATVLRPDVRSGFSVYNNDGESVPLRIPPTPESMSGYESSSDKRSAESGVWHVTVSAWTERGERLPRVYCGYSAADDAGEGKRFFAAPHTFLKTALRVRDSRDGGLYGHQMVHRMEEGGCSYELAFTNRSASDRAIRYRVAPEGVPEGMSVAVFDPAAKRFEESAAPLRVSVGKRGVSYRLLVVGDDGYRRKVIAGLGKFSLQGCYPNPFGRSVNINYTIPLFGIERVEFTIYNSLGRAVWRREVSEALRFGMNAVSWDARNGSGRRVSTGLYLLKIRARDTINKQWLSFERRLFYLP
jgi:plastocyanin